VIITNPKPTSKTSNSKAANANNDPLSEPLNEVLEPVETYEQYGQTYNIYYREKLYQEVWEKPVVEIAKRYSVSDVSIHKVCKSLDIPTPGLGYWAKVRAGKPTKQIPLPNSDKSDKKSGMRADCKVCLSPTQPNEKELLDFLSTEDKTIVLSVAMQIGLPSENARMHSKIIVHRKKVNEWHKENRKRDSHINRRYDNTSMPFLTNTVSEAALPRVCRIFDALIKAMEPLGCQPTDDLQFVVNGEIVTVSVTEAKDKLDHVLTKEENIKLLKYEEDKRKYSWASKPNIRKYDYVYNGKITFLIESNKSFRDCKSYVIEDRLGDILVLLYEASDINRKRREERETAERKRKEEEQLREERRERYNVEVERTQSLANEAEDYSIACQIRTYISAIEQNSDLTQEVKKWILWAKQKADWYDPTIKREDEYFGSREHNKNTDDKKLKPSYSSWGW
jgi:hypothetical protein